MSVEVKDGSSGTASYRLCRVLTGLIVDVTSAYAAVQVNTLTASCCRLLTELKTVDVTSAYAAVQVNAPTASCCRLLTGLEIVDVTSAYAAVQVNAPTASCCRLLTGLKIVDVTSAYAAMQQLLESGVKTVVISSTDLGDENTLLALASTTTGTGWLSLTAVCINLLLL